MVKLFACFFFTGIDSIAFDPQRFAMDYHIIGFRECATEVARYLVTFEGMDIQDPLRLRLMSHLQCFVAQWEVKSNHSYQPTAGYHTPPSYQNYPTATSTSSNSYHYPTPPNPVTPIHLQHTASSTMAPDTTNAQHQQQQQQQQQTGHLHGQQQQQQQQQHYATGHETTQQQPLQTLQHHTDPNNPQEPTYTDLSSSVHASRLTSVSLGYGNPQYPSSSAQTYDNEVAGSGYNNNGKQNPPYRPWGAEMAY
jgi:hairy and enhancer of split related with YRPW motif